MNSQHTLTQINAFNIAMTKLILKPLSLELSTISTETLQ